MSSEIFHFPANWTMTYQYVPAPWDVRSMPSEVMFSSSIILLRPKSVILISPLTDPLPSNIFPVIKKSPINDNYNKLWYTYNTFNIHFTYYTIQLLYRPVVYCGKDIQWLSSWSIYFEKVYLLKPTSLQLLHEQHIHILKVYGKNCQLAAYLKISLSWKIININTDLIYSCSLISSSINTKSTIQYNW